MRFNVQCAWQWTYFSVRHQLPGPLGARHLLCPSVYLTWGNNIIICFTDNKSNTQSSLPGSKPCIGYQGYDLELCVNRGGGEACKLSRISRWQCWELHRNAQVVCPWSWPCVGTFSVPGESPPARYSSCQPVKGSCVGSVSSSPCKVHHIERLQSPSLLIHVPRYCSLQAHNLQYFSVSKL